MFRRRGFITLALAASVFVAGALPAYADAKLVKKKSFTAPHGRKGSVHWYRDNSGGRVTNYVKITAKDNDGRGGKCTETWFDYATKPHKHFNPGVVVNCSGKQKTVSKFHVNHYYGISGIQVVVCEVPKTSGKIIRNGKNCRGNLKGIYLRSGKRYSQFKSKGVQWPSGVVIKRI